MIGNIIGEVLFSDGSESIIMTNSGVGYQVFCTSVLIEGSIVSLFIGHIIKEASQDLYGFKTLRDKKMFELLLSVKGVGPKSAYNLLTFLGVDQIITSVMLENKKLLTTAPGVGAKAASQILLDLCGKVQKIKMFANKIIVADTQSRLLRTEGVTILEKNEIIEAPTTSEMGDLINDKKIIDETLMACSQLGFKEEEIIPIAQKIMKESLIGKAEQLVHLVLKEL